MDLNCNYELIKKNKKLKEKIIKKLRKTWLNDHLDLLKPNMVKKLLQFNEKTEDNAIFHLCYEWRDNGSSELYFFPMDLYIL